jgi:hypothetical protein
VLKDIVVETALVIADWNLSSKHLIDFEHIFREAQVCIDALVHSLLISFK